jgi:hypothetical protein
MPQELAAEYVGPPEFKPAHQMPLDKTSGVSV